MAKLKYKITGFGIRGFYDTKHEWEVKKNAWLTVKKEMNGCVSAFDGDVRAGSMPKELQENLRGFLKIPNTEIQAKILSLQPVNKGIGKGEEISCVINLTGENLVVVKNSFEALKEAVKKIQKSTGDKGIKMRKVTVKDSIEGKSVGSNARTDESKTNERMLKSSNKNKNNSSKRKRADMDDGYSPNIKKPRASTSTDYPEEFDKKNLRQNGQSISWDQRKLSADDCYRLSEHIGKNWQLLGNELDIPQVKIDQIEENHRDARRGIQRMLRLWTERSKDASICNFLQALEVCRSVTFDRPAIDQYFEKYHNC